LFHEFVFAPAIMHQQRIGIPAHPDRECLACSHRDDPHFDS
jgi:hypothetical protein